MNYDVICLGEVMVELSLNDATPDTAGIMHALYVKAVLRGDRLSGTVSAVSIDAWRTFGLPHWIELRR